MYLNFNCLLQKQNLPGNTCTSILLILYTCILHILLILYTCILHVHIPVSVDKNELKTLFMYICWLYWNCSKQLHCIIVFKKFVFETTTGIHSVFLLENRVIILIFERFVIFPNIPYVIYTMFNDVLECSIQCTGIVWV